MPAPDYGWICDHCRYAYHHIHEWYCKRCSAPRGGHYTLTQLWALLTLR